MGHHIRGFIARADELRDAAVSLPGARVVSLLQGFGFLPVTDQLAGDDEPVSIEQVERLTDRLSVWAKEQSRSFPLAYVETDYFGGDGWQVAIAWDQGDGVFGPVRTTDLWEGGRFVPTPLLEGAINRAVRHLGVERGAERDEFDALGLGHHRSNESWLSEGGTQ
jgi:hypothetical protein